MKKIIVTIDTLGKPIIEAEGFSGTSCKEATDGLTRALSEGAAGNVVLDKPEIYAVEEVDEQNHLSY